jgi:hypothetical protein
MILSSNFAISVWPFQPDHNRKTPLQIAKDSGNVEMSEFLERAKLAFRGLQQKGLI